MVSCFNSEFPNDVFTFNIRSVIHFEFVFVKGVRCVSRFYFFLPYGCPVAGGSIFEKTVSVALCYLHSFVRGHSTLCGSVSGFCFCPVGPFVYSFASSPVSGLPLLYSKS